MDVKKKIQTKLKENVDRSFKTFNSQRETDIEELSTLYQRLETLSDQRRVLIETQESESKNYLPNRKVMNQCELKLFDVEKKVKEAEKKSDLLFKRLTALPDGFLQVYPFFKMI
ncbi:MAG: hypothetical protein FJ115_05400 [Deltaproteobacteria bacterium]|nr:hypothetical protein [Deltaproteobacteria bacterium]